jgi:uncharacterized protein YbjQ (UPF0145 family)
MLFDNREVTKSWAEICAYGTAVVIEALPDARTAERAA